MAQYDVQYSQFFFNKLAFNPAYAGSRDALTLGAVYRHQWSGIDGAPRTASAYVHMPFMKNRQGAGLSLTSDKIGIINLMYADISYAYRIPLGAKSTLGLGLSGRFEYGQINWEEAQINDFGDTSVPAAGENFTTPNFGAGIFYSNPNFYIGFSVPQLLKNGLFNSEFYNGRSGSDVRTYYLMSGFTAKLNSNVWFRPNAMLSYNPNAPLELDLNASFLLMQSLWIGASWRLDDSIDGIIQYQFSPQFKAGVAMDFTTSELQKYTNGTLEFLVEYTFWYGNDKLQHLRFF